MSTSTELTAREDTAFTEGIVTGGIGADRRFGRHIASVHCNRSCAEGRLVMCDALELAVDERHDAIVDIAPLTGSCVRALGNDIAGIFGNDTRH